SYPGEDLRANGPHPYNDFKDGSYLVPDPIQGFPSLPPKLENPFLAYGPLTQSDDEYVWQVVQPVGDGLVFELRTLTISYDEYLQVLGTLTGGRVVWRRGDPWWSLVTSLNDKYGSEPPAGGEVKDGRLVYGRLLHPGDPEWPKD